MLLSRPNFVQLCGKWKERNKQSGIFSDIYDGAMWERFRYYNDMCLLDIPHNLGFMLNVDWLQPYEHLQYSVGIIYLSVLNLPRSERYNLENIIVVGCIPGPNEPQNMNAYLKPMVDELLLLWDGILFQPYSYAVPVLIKCCLIGIACDVPATRKVCGFTACTSTQGCSKCMKTFPCASFGEKLDFSGYDRSSWLERTLKLHSEAIFALQNATCQSKKDEVEKQFGVRYSEIVRLPYFNVIAQHVIEPMHNLGLGTEKHIVGIWKDIGLLGPADFEIIQERVDSMVVPYGVGRIPLKICSRLSGLTADQWKNWTNIYSLYALRGVIPDEHYFCWSIFVEASLILSQHSISLDALTHADQKLLQFCSRFENLYGKQACTPNMHLHCHIKECILNYGPIPSFWAFPFERYNGIMQSFVNNWISPEMQMMRRFTSYQSVVSNSQFWSTASTELNEIVDRATLPCEGSLLETSIDGYEKVGYLNNSCCAINSINALMLDKVHKTGSKLLEKYFSDQHLNYISSVYMLLYPNYNSSSRPFILKAHIVFYDLIVMGEHFLSTNSRSQGSSVIMAKWCGFNGQICSNSMHRFGEIQYFFTHVFITPECNSEQRHLFAWVKWYCRHPRESSVTKPLQLLSTDFEPEGPASIIPISRITCRCAISVREKIPFDYGEDYAFFVCPLSIH